MSNIEQVREIAHDVIGREVTEGKMPKVHVYDNAGKTLDRYTIVPQGKGWEYDRAGTRVHMLGVGSDPRGYSQWTGGVEGKHLGKKIKFSDLPKNVQQHVKMRLTEDVDIEREELTEIAIGQIVNTKGIRVERYADHMRVWDLTNAGKRGKRVDKFSIGPIYQSDTKDFSFREKHLVLIAKQNTYKRALEIAKFMVQKLQKMGDNIKIHQSTERGVNVDPPDKGPITVKTAKVSISATPRHFSVTDKTDPHNLPTMIPSLRRRVTSAKMFYKMAQELGNKLKSMSYLDIGKEMNRRKIDYHGYYAMD